MTDINRVTLIVLDSAGVGALPDADKYGDIGSNTIGHIGDKLGLDLPNMEKMGLGNIIDIGGVKKVSNPTALYGKAAEKSKGKDTTTGHWEIAGIILDEPFPTYPNGFPEEIINEFKKKTGKGVLGNKVASGTVIINELGDKHVETGDLIVYTSADSVFQIAAHEEVVPVKKLYEYCEIAREMLDVGRVIARPFIGKNGDYTRTANRHDYSIEPTSKTMMDKIVENNLDVLAVGKIRDIFAGHGVTDYVKTKNNMDGVDKTLEYMKSKKDGLIFSNLVDFDMLYGHRRNVRGYKESLENFDKRLPEILDAMRDDEVLIITADHGCDPTFKGTDHTREYIPILAYGKNIGSGDIGKRDSFSDISETIEYLLLEKKTDKSFIK
ncbi:MAG: phosphopentomutase [Fusobacteriota bacterium]